MSKAEKGKGLDTRELDALLEKGDDNEIADAVKWLRQIIYADPSMLFWEKTGVAKTPNEWPDEVKASVKRISRSDRGVFTVEFHDPLSALDKLAKILGWYQANAAELTPLEELMLRLPRDKLKTALEVLVLISEQERAPEPVVPVPEEVDGDDEIHFDHGKIGRLVGEAE